MACPVSACDSLLRLTLEPSSNSSVAGSRDWTTYLPAPSNATATGCPGSVFSSPACELGVATGVKKKLVPFQGASHKLALEATLPPSPTVALGPALGPSASGAACMLSSRAI